MLNQVLTDLVRHFLGNLLAVYDPARHFVRVSGPGKLVAWILGVVLNADWLVDVLLVVQDVHVQIDA